MTGLRSLHDGLANLGHTIFDKSPLWFQEGWNKRRRAALGFRLLATHASGNDCENLCNIIAEFKQKSGLSRHNKEPKVERSTMHNILAQTTFITPTIIAGLCTAFATPASGLVVQVTDCVRLDSGNAFLDGLEDHGIDLEKSDHILRGLLEPDITRDLYKYAGKSGVVELLIGSVSLGVGDVAFRIGENISHFVPAEKITDLFAHTAAKLLPNVSQAALRGGIREITAKAIGQISSVFSLAGNKGVASTRPFLKDGVRSSHLNNIEASLKDRRSGKAEALSRVHGLEIKQDVVIDTVGGHPIWAAKPQKHIDPVVERLELDTAPKAISEHLHKNPHPKALDKGPS